MTELIISFKEVDNTDLIFLKSNLLCTIDYEGDFEVESTRKNIRRLFNHWFEKGGMND